MTGTTPDKSISIENTSEKPRGISRRHDLDGLRAVAMLLGIVLHAAISFVPAASKGWAVQDVNQASWMSWMIAAVHGFRMPLFFMISGFFTAMLWRKRGLRSLLRHRAKRILLPLVIGLFTIVPLVWIVSIAAAVTKNAGGLAGGGGDSLPVVTAAFENDLPKLQQLLKDSPDLEELDPVWDSHALMVASWRGNLESVDLLLDAGADVNARSANNTTALHVAALFGREDIAKRLLDAGADPTLKNDDGSSSVESLKAPWEITQFLATVLQVKLERNDVDQGREEIGRLFAAHLEDGDSRSDTSKPNEIESSPDADTGKPSGLSLALMHFPVFHHLWFLWFLCWLVVAFVLYSALPLPDLSTKPWALLVSSPLNLLWLLPITFLLQSTMGLAYPTFGPDTSVGLVPFPNVLGYYAVFFFFGALYFDCQDDEGRLGRYWYLTVPFAFFVVFPIGYSIIMDGFAADWFSQQWRRPLAVGLQATYAWLMTFGSIGFFRSCFSKENFTMRYLSDSSYWLYVAHLPLVIAAAWLVAGWELPAELKFVLVCVACSALLLLSYQYCVRYTPIGTLLNGKKHRASSPTASYEGASQNQNASPDQLAAPDQHPRPEA